MAAAVSHLSPYSGSWYPDDPAELQELLDELFTESERRTGRLTVARGMAYIVPHAGLVYSGAVGAAAYRRMAADGIESIALMGFSHRGGEPGAWIPKVDAIRTPGGQTEVDRELRAALAEGGVFGLAPEEVLCDHSVEIQLPLLRRAAPGARIVPIYVNGLDEAARAEAAGRLAAAMGPRTALVASSDLTHYGREFRYEPFPVDEWTPQRLRDLDEDALFAASSLSAGVFLKALAESGATVCGREPIALLIETLRLLERKEEIFPDTLDYRNSGEITDDYRHAVSYGAVGYFPESSFRLEREEQELLVDSARRTLRRYVETGERKPIPPARIPPGLERRAGAFVTLHKQGELRGCVGRRASAEPLWETVPSMTLAAMLEDTRFRPVKKGEEGIDLDISILSPFKLLANLDDFRAGEHGALLDAGMHQGVLLPQVATERGWGAQEFFEALARKTGVTADVYRQPGTRVSVFRAQIIH
jgi:AmmeMemoRadiSam system protein B/AmmeMemoRadiSam system protein A